MISSRVFKDMHETNQVEYLWHSANKLTFDEFQNLINIYYKEREWNENCD